MEFLSLPDDVIVDMMVSKLSLNEIGNLTKTNRRMRDLFYEILNHEQLYRQYLDNHFPYLEEQSIIPTGVPKDPIYILFPYQQKVYKSDDLSFYKENLIGGSIVAMERTDYDGIIYLTNMGELYSFYKNVAQRLVKEKRFVRIMNNNEISVITEDGDVYFNLDVKESKFVMEFMNFIKNPFDVFSVVGLDYNTKIGILINNGIFLTPEGAKKYPSPLFYINHSYNSYIVSSNDLSILINIKTGEKTHIGFNVVNKSSHGGKRLLVDEHMNIYDFREYENHKKIQFIDNNKFSNITCIGGRENKFIIIDNDMLYWAILQGKGYIIKPITLFDKPEKIIDIVDEESDDEEIMRKPSTTRYQIRKRFGL